MMATEIENFDTESSGQGCQSEGMDGVSVLSTLLLSVLLKVEEKEYRSSPNPSQPGPTAAPDHKKWIEDEESYLPSERGVVELDEDEMWQYQKLGLVGGASQDEEETNDGVGLVLHDGDNVPFRHAGVTYCEVSLMSSSDNSQSPPSMELTTISPTKVTIPEDITLITQSGDTSLQTRSAYQDTAVGIVAEALLRAIANIYINGVLRRSLRSAGEFISATCRGRWSISTNACNGNEEQDGVTDGGDCGVVEHTTQNQSFKEPCDVGSESQTSKQPILVMSDERNQTKSTRLGVISPEWLLDVNRRIAAAGVTINHADIIIPSAGTSRDVSRCSSVSVLSSGDRSLRVKATPPSQSKLLWTVVQKMDGGTSSSSVLKKLSEESSHDSQTPKTEGHLSQVPSDLEKEKAILLAKLSSGHQEMLQIKGVCADIKQEHDKVSDDNAEVSPEPVARADVCSPQTARDETSQLHAKLKSLPPAASPLLKDVVWRHALSLPNCAIQEEDLNVSHAGGSVRQRQEAKCVVESALCRAVSSLFVDRLISDSITSLSSHDNLHIDLRSTPSFKEAVRDLTGDSIRGFQWFPYREEIPAGPFKVVDQRRGRQGDEKTDKDTQTETVDKQASSESSETYMDARDKFGSSDDLLDHSDSPRQNATSDEDEDFTDAMCEPEYQQKPHTSDKSTQVSHTDPSYDEIEDELEEDLIEVELPLESINYIKDQFNDVKALVDEYRQMLYAPLSYDEGVTHQDTQTRKSNGDGISKGDEKILDDEDGSVKDDIEASKTRGAKPNRETSTETEAPSTSMSSQITTKQGTSEDVERSRGTPKDSSLDQRPFSFGSYNYEDSSGEDASITSPRSKSIRKHMKGKSKGQTQHASPNRGKAKVPGNLRKRETKLRTPTGRPRVVATFREKTTPDGFLPASSKTKPIRSPKSEKPSKRLRRQAPDGKRSAKNEETPGTSSQEKEQSTSDGLSEIKHRISFFEKLSRHRMGEKDARSSPKSRTPVKQPISTEEKTERLTSKSAAKQKGRTHKNDNDADGKRHIDFKHFREKLTGMKKDKHKNTNAESQDNVDSCIDYTPGNGIRANAAFFEALGKLEDPTSESKKSPTTSRKIADEGLLNPNQDDKKEEPTTKDTAKYLEVERATDTDQFLDRTKEEGEGRETSSPGKKRRSRNRNANNQALLDHLGSTDDSCISSRESSNTNTAESADAGLESVIKTDLQNQEPSSERGPCSESTSDAVQELATKTASHDEVSSTPCPCDDTEEHELPNGVLHSRDDHMEEAVDIPSVNSEGGESSDVINDQATSPKLLDGNESESHSIGSDATDQKQMSTSSKQSREAVITVDQTSENSLTEDSGSHENIHELAELSGDLETNEEFAHAACCEKNQLADLQTHSTGDPSENYSEDGLALKDIEIACPDSEPVRDQVHGGTSCQEEQLHSSPPTKDAENISKLDMLQDPLLATSPRPQRNFLSNSALSSDNDDAGETKNSPLSPEGADDDDDERRLVCALGESSSLRSCSSDLDFYGSSDEDASPHQSTNVGEDDASWRKKHLDVRENNTRQQPSKILCEPNTSTITDSEPITSSLTIGDDRVGEEKTPDDAEESGGKRKKRSWRIRLFCKKHARNKKNPEKNASSSINTSQEKLRLASATGDDAVVAPVVEETKEKSVKVSISGDLENNVPHKRRFIFGSLKMTKKHKMKTP